MTLFIFVVAALVLVTLFSLLRPWWKKPTGGRRVTSADKQDTEGELARDTAAQNFSALINTTIHRDRLAELTRDFQNGVISATGYAQAQEELQRQVLEDAAQPQDVSATGTRLWRDGLLLAVLVPLVALGLYLLVGNPAGLAGGGNAANGNAELLAKVNGLIAQLEKKMQDNPNNPEGWMMLARAYKLTGRLDDAERALGRIGPTINQNASMLADLAEILAQKNGTLAGRPGELVLQALQLEPDNGKALYLAGAAAFEGARYKAAIAHWERLQRQVDPQSEDARNIAEALAKAHEMAGEKVGAADTASEAKMTNAQVAGAMTVASAVSGRVDISPVLRSQTTPNETVFVFARAVNGSRMPLAIQKVHVADLPLDFHLDDTQAMSPENKISTAKALRVEVRVSKSGQAMPAPGDLTGSSAPVAPGAQGVQVMIDQVIK